MILKSQVVISGMKKQHEDVCHADADQGWGRIPEGTVREQLVGTCSLR